MRRAGLLMMFLLGAMHRMNAQHDSTFTASQGAHYIYAGYNNDTFTYTDRYYTHGFRIEIANPHMSRMFTRHLLPVLRSSSHTYGITLVQDMFTPSTITNDFMIRGDRPYAAYMYAGSFAVSASPHRKLLFTAELDAGIIGPYAMGYEVQSGFHHLIHNRIPQGWASQVSNDVVLNYTVAVEKGLLSVGKVIDLSVLGSVNAGTLYDNASAGLALRIGKMKSRFEIAPVTRRSWQLYLFTKCYATAVAYNATLQGGMLTSSNDYTLRLSDMEQGLYSAEGGVVLGWRHMELTHSYHYLSPELRTGMAHRWGHCSIRILL